METQLDSQETLLQSYTNMMKPLVFLASSMALGLLACILMTN